MTYPMLRRRRITSPVAWPFTRPSPLLGDSRRFASFRVVVFPEPLRPSSTSVFPRRTSRFNPESTCWPVGSVEETSQNSMARSLAAVDSMSVKDNGVGEDWYETRDAFSQKQHRHFGAYQTSFQPRIGTNPSGRISPGSIWST